MQPFPTFPKCSLFHIFNYFLYLNFNFSCNTYVAQPSISLASTNLKQNHNIALQISKPQTFGAFIIPKYCFDLLLWMLQATHDFPIYYYDKFTHVQVVVYPISFSSNARNVVYFLFLVLVPFLHLYLQNLYIKAFILPLN